MDCPSYASIPSSCQCPPSLLVTVSAGPRKRPRISRRRAQPAPGYPQRLPSTNGLGQPGGAGPMPERMAVVDPDKKLSAGDQVTVEIVEDRDAGLSRVVTATGELDVPPLGHVKVSGRTTTEAASDIKQLLEKDYYHRATVRISIERVSSVAVRSGVVYLSGEVRLRGPQEMAPGRDAHPGECHFAGGQRDDLGRCEEGQTHAAKERWDPPPWSISRRSSSRAMRRMTPCFRTATVFSSRRRS